MSKNKLIFLVITVLILSPFLYFISNIILGVWSIRDLENNLKDGQIKKISSKSKLSANSFSHANKFLNIGSPLYSLIGLDNKIRKIEDLFFLAENISASIALSSEAAEKSEKIFYDVFSGKQSNLNENLPEIKNLLEEAYDRTSLSQSLLNNFDGKEKIVGKYILKAKTFLPEWRSLLWQGNELVGITPKILASKERKTYLLLFQNNMELRPTGGFIGSFGLVTFEKERLLDFEIMDVYSADGQLRGHVDPPAKLKEFLGQENWYLRDSNWDPDFTTSAMRAQWFLEKEIGRKVDGVISLDLFVAQRFLKTYGEVNLPDYNEKINERNFFERAQYHNEVGFFPGTTSKKDFLGAVSRAIFERLKNAKTEELAKTGMDVLTSLEEKDILLYVDESEAMKVFSKYNWDGGIKNVKCNPPAGGEKAKCFVDYLMMVEANVGVNKANYFLERDLEIKTKINPDGRVEKKLTINYKNNSPSETFPGGSYKNYLRLYVPQESVIQECMIGDLECQIEETSEHSRTVFGFLVQVPVGKRQRVEVAWTLPGAFGQGQYRFFLQKQPGTRNDKLLVSFSHPRELSLTGKTPLIYNTTLSQDKIVDLEFE
ncbi:MAG: DUF4012 domain-containing protein [bacterium]|nr:DUF4012 domain-containing protein [bacterium]